MSNLIPPDAQKRVKLEYWIRVVSMWMLLVGSASLMVALLQVPVYVLVKEQLSVFGEWYDEVSADSEEFKSSSDIINQSNRVSEYIRSEEKPLFFSDIISEIDRISSAEIKIDSYQITKAEGQVERLSVTGRAESRSTLADFRTELENSSLFSTAALPLSNLAKDIDIPFNISITLANQEVSS